MNYGCCTICKRAIEEGESVIVTGVTITSGQFPKNEAHYAHQVCQATPRPNHVRDAVEANR